MAAIVYLNHIPHLNLQSEWFSSASHCVCVYMPMFLYCLNIHTFWGAITIIINPKYSMKLDWFSIEYYRLILHNYNDISDHRFNDHFSAFRLNKILNVLNVRLRNCTSSIERFGSILREFFLFSFLSAVFPLFYTYRLIILGFFLQKKKMIQSDQPNWFFVHFIFRKHKISNTHWKKGKLTKLRIILFCSTKMKRCPRNN